MAALLAKEMKVACCACNVVEIADKEHQCSNQIMERNQSHLECGLRLTGC